MPMKMTLPQQVTYWAPLPRNQHGELSFASPVLVRGRWEDKTQQIVTPAGEDYTSSAVCFVDTDLQMNGFLCVGDFTMINDPRSVDAARQIQSYVAIPDIRNVSKERRAYL